MDPQPALNYDRIAEAIGYIRSNFQRQPDLDEVARMVHLSPFHFQRMFTEWAGVSPKKFLQFTSIEHAKAVLRQGRATLFDAALDTGLSGTGRLHDLFIGIEGMTPGEFKNGGTGLAVNFSFAPTPFGKMLVASTPKGICHAAFCDEEVAALGELKSRFPNARFRQATDTLQQDALRVFEQGNRPAGRIKLHLNGTAFQLKVWEALLKIPSGGLATYGGIAEQLQSPGASRAVGTAVGSNPVAFLIPCHRVIRAGGGLGGYHWGSDRKAAMIGWEMARAAAN